MAREKEGFRDQLESLRERFPEREAISIDESCRILGVHRDTLMKERDFPMRKVSGKYVIPLVGLARWMS